MDCAQVRLESLSRVIAVFKGQGRPSARLLGLRSRRALYLYLPREWLETGGPPGAVGRLLCCAAGRGSSYLALQVLLGGLLSVIPYLASRARSGGIPPLLGLAVLAAGAAAGFLLVHYDSLRVERCLEEWMGLDPGSIYPEIRSAERLLGEMLALARACPGGGCSAALRAGGAEYVARARLRPLGGLWVEARRAGRLEEAGGGGVTRRGGSGVSDL